MAGKPRVITPSQTVGPFFSSCLTRHPAHLSLLGGPTLLTRGVVGDRVTITGTLHDGAADPVPDALIEVWQADSEGHYAGEHSGVTAFTGFGRVECDAAGRFVIETIKPGPVAAPDDGLQAPHIALGIFAKGLNRRLYTRLYFDDEPANEDDPVLRSVPVARRATLIAHSRGDARYEFVIRLQGTQETVFFEA